MRLADLLTSTTGSPLCATCQLSLWDNPGVVLQRFRALDTPPNPVAGVFQLVLQCDCGRETSQLVSGGALHALLDRLTARQPILGGS